jgi:hypothetical protein
MKLSLEAKWMILIFLYGTIFWGIGMPLLFWLTEK